MTTHVDADHSSADLQHQPLRDAAEQFSDMDEVPFFVGPGFAKLFRLPADGWIGQHVHKSAHLGMLLLGTVRVTAGASVVEYQAPSAITLSAGIAHEIEAVTDALWACVWPDADGAVTEAEFEAKVVARPSEDESHDIDG